MFTVLCKQMPEIEEINKGNIYLSSTSPESVSRAYFEQFQKDFLRFLRCRSEEVMAGGRMVITLAGRTTDDPRDEESNRLWRPFTMALQDMVFEVIKHACNIYNITWIIILLYERTFSVSLCISFQAPSICML